MGHVHPGAAGPVFWYAVVQLLCAVSYTALTVALLRLHPDDAPLARALGRDRKGRVSLGAYALGVAVAPKLPVFTVAVIGAVAVLWLVPDRRVMRIAG